jgi:hypothetical protein
LFINDGDLSGHACALEFSSQSRQQVWGSERKNNLHLRVTLLDNAYRMKHLSCKLFQFLEAASRHNGDCLPGSIESKLIKDMFGIGL